MRGGDADDHIRLCGKFLLRDSLKGQANVFGNRFKRWQHVRVGIPGNHSLEVTLLRSGS